jgi:hypothetical protein
VRRFTFCVLETFCGYVLGAMIGYSLISQSSNSHDSPVEAAMTGAFASGPIGAVVGGVAGFLLGKRRG